jgi:AcrR family transcriptional regulator
MLLVSYKRMNDKGKQRIVARWEGSTPGASGKLVAGEASPDATEAKLLAGTLDCLRRLGLRGTTSRAIAAAAGANLGAITYHFGSKDELVAQALLSAVRGWMEPALEVLRRDMDPAERLLAAVQHLQTAFEGAREMLPVYLEALVAAPRHDTLRRGVEGLLAEIRGFLSAQLLELQQIGYVPPWVEPETMAMLLVSTADGIALHAALEPAAVDPGALANQAVQLLLAARSDQTPRG